MGSFLWFVSYSNTFGSRNRVSAVGTSFTKVAGGDFDDNEVWGTAAAFAGVGDIDFVEVAVNYAVVTGSGTGVSAGGPSFTEVAGGDFGDNKGWGMAVAAEGDFGDNDGCGIAVADVEDAGNSSLPSGGGT